MKNFRKRARSESSEEGAPSACAAIQAVRAEQRDRRRMPCGVAPRPKRRIATVADMLTS
jgi:hypothetical protein